MDLSTVRSQFRGALKEAGSVVATELMCEDAAQMESLKVVWIILAYLETELIGLPETTGCLQTDRGGEFLVHRLLDGHGSQGGDTLALPVDSKSSGHGHRPQIDTCAG